MFSMLLFFISSRFTIGKKAITSYTNAVSLNLIVTTGIIIAVIICISYGPSVLKIVSFEDVYGLRFANQSILNEKPLLAYLVLWTSYFFIPVFIAVGLFLKRKWIVIISCLMALLIYAATGSKATILLPCFAFGLYFCLKYISFSYFLPTITTAFLGVYIAFLAFGEYSSTLTTLTSILLMRTLSISGWCYNVYIDFFQTHPYTCYSHIGVVNKITGMYPYEAPLGKVVGGWKMGQDIHSIETINANAHFLVTDGIAAYGLLGIVFISIIFFFLMVVLNKLSERHNKDVVFIVLLGSTLSLLNVSMFITLLSCGLIFTMLFFRYTTLRRKNEKR
jgi:hypothetical protein